MKAKKWFLEILVYLLAALFFMAAGSKLADMKEFSWEINNQPFDNNLTPYLIWLIPVIELIIMVCLLWPRLRLIGLYGSAFLMSIFTIYIALVTFNVFDRQPCGCAFGFEKLTWPQHLMVNTGLTLLSIAGIYILKYENEIQHKTLN